MLSIWAEARMFRMKRLILILLAVIAILAAVGYSVSAYVFTPNNQKIVVKYSTVIYAVPWIGTVQEFLPSSDSELVIAQFSVENQGYPEFEINKTYFSAVVKGGIYNYDSSCYANDLLPDTKIGNGGISQGNVPFNLPDLTMDPDITWQYSGPGKYSIEWVNVELTPPVTSQTGG